jgi:6,7-dimethyl-8-ribityllumazine synthase
VSERLDGGGFPAPQPDLERPERFVPDEEAEERPPLKPAEAKEPPEHAAGEFELPEGYRTVTGSSEGEGRTVAVVVSKFNSEITSRLLEQALEELAAAGVSQDAITITPVPGAFELPLAAIALAKTRRYSCIVALGCVIRGETPHFDYVAGEAASGLQLAAIETGVPVSFGVLTTETTEQAEARIDRARDAVRSALEMAGIFTQLRTASQ